MGGILFRSVVVKLLHLSKSGHKNKASTYATYDRRASKNGGPMPGEGPQYDEIPYGDVGPNFSGKGKLPQVPDDYSQVPQIPARQGLCASTNSFHPSIHPTNQPVSQQQPELMTEDQHYLLFVGTVIKLKASLYSVSIYSSLSLSGYFSRLGDMMEIDISVCLSFCSEFSLSPYRSELVFPFLFFMSAV